MNCVDRLSLLPPPPISPTMEPTSPPKPLSPPIKLIRNPINLISHNASSTRAPNPSLKYCPSEPGIVAPITKSSYNAATMLLLLLLLLLLFLLQLLSERRRRRARENAEDWTGRRSVDEAAWSSFEGIVVLHVRLLDERVEVGIILTLKDSPD